MSKHYSKKLNWHEILIKESESYIISDLEKLYTKQLINKLREVNLCGSEYDSESKKENLDRYIKSIKQVLSTREHIPNKIESKKIRQEKAKKKI